MHQILFYFLKIVNASYFYLNDETDHTPPEHRRILFSGCLYYLFRIDAANRRLLGLRQICILCLGIASTAPARITALDAPWKTRHDAADPLGSCCPLQSALR